MNESESNQLIIEEGKQGDIHVPTTLCDEIDDAACLGSELNQSNRELIIFLTSMRGHDGIYERIFDFYGNPIAE